MTRAIALVMTALLIGCARTPAALTQLVEARQLTSNLRVQFTRASDAANRAVMSSAEGTGSAAVNESRQAADAVAKDLAALKLILERLAYHEELRILETFTNSFQEYRKIDDELLPLAVENTNVKAQQLSFDSSREAAAAFKNALESAVSVPSTKAACCVASLVAAAHAAVLEVRVLQAPHIAEPDDAPMTRMEAQMAAHEAEARRALERLRPLLADGAGPHLAKASAALDRFVAVNREIITLSRRNTNVRSLALTLGRKRTVVATCEDQLRALDEALARHEFAATR